MVGDGPLPRTNVKLKPEDQLSLDEMVQLGNKVESWTAQGHNSYFGHHGSVEIKLWTKEFSHREGIDVKYHIEARSQDPELYGLLLGSASDDNQENNRLEGLYKKASDYEKAQSEKRAQEALKQARDLLK